MTPWHLVPARRRSRSCDARATHGRARPCPRRRRRLRPSPSAPRRRRGGAAGGELLDAVVRLLVLVLGLGDLPSPAVAPAAGRRLASAARVGPGAASIAGVASALAPLALGVVDVASSRLRRPRPRPSSATSAAPARSLVPASRPALADRARRPRRPLPSGRGLAALGSIAGAGSAAAASIARGALGVARASSWSRRAAAAGHRLGGWKARPGGRRGVPAPAGRRAIRVDGARRRGRRLTSAPVPARGGAELRPGACCLRAAAAACRVRRVRAGGDSAAVSASAAAWRHRRPVGPGCGLSGTAAVVAFGWGLSRHSRPPPCAAVGSATGRALRRGSGRVGRGCDRFGAGLARRRRPTGAASGGGSGRSRRAHAGGGALRAGGRRRRIRRGLWSVLWRRAPLRPRRPARCRAFGGLRTLPGAVRRTGLVLRWSHLVAADASGSAVPPRSAPARRRRDVLGRRPEPAAGLHPRQLDRAVLSVRHRVADRRATRHGRPRASSSARECVPTGRDRADRRSARAASACP